MGPWQYPHRKRERAHLFVAYQKPLLTFRQQAEQLIARGMQGNVATIEQRLRMVNYYRLSGYFYFFREHQGPNRHKGEQYRPNTTFDQILELYRFDSRLRGLVSEALETIEIAIRTQVSFYHAQKFGNFAYALDEASVQPFVMIRDQQTRREHRIPKRKDFMAELQKNLERSKEQFIEHFYDTYADEYPPLFIASEVITLGCLKHIYQGAPEDVQRLIATVFRLPPSVFGSWLLTLNTVRNVCAHHGRFWNRSLGSRPKVPPNKKPHEFFHTPVEIFAQPKLINGSWTQPPTAFAILSMCNYLLTEIDPDCTWALKVSALLDEFPNVKKTAMGFPEGWKNSPVWKPL